MKLSTLLDALSGLDVESFSMRDFANHVRDNTIPDAKQKRGKDESKVIPYSMKQAKTHLEGLISRGYVEELSEGEYTLTHTFHVDYNLTWDSEREIVSAMHQATEDR